jgi:hypothetical protein
MRHRIPFDAAVAVAAAFALGGCASSRETARATPDKAAPATSSSSQATGPAQAHGGAGATVPTVVAQTSEERRAAIDRKLDDSLGTFDAQLRKEQERVAKERDARQEGAVATGKNSATTEPQSTDERSDGGSGTPSTEGPDQDARGNAGGKRGNSERKSAHAGDLKSEKSASSAATRRDNAGNGATARNIPDGSDDDVVARRLRRAAEQETDPELKDKLWKEYVDYKNNAGK